MSAKARIKDARARWRLVTSVPLLSKRLAWTSAKLIGAYALAEAARRVRAGPLGLAVTAPPSAVEGDSILVEARVEAPFPLVALDAYFGGEWQAAEYVPVGRGRATWLFRAAEPGLRPVVVRARDAEGHAITRTRWILVFPESASRLAPARRRLAVEAAPERAPEPTA